MKWLLGLVVLLIVAAGLFWLPPHWQVRSASVALPSTDSVTALLSAADKPVRATYVLNSSQPTAAGRLGHVAFLLEWADGRLFMIDTGMDETQAAAFGQLLVTIGLSEEAASFHGDVVDTLGVAANRVQGVGFTHLHIDHTQGLQAFCAGRAEVTGFQTEAQRDQHNFNTSESAGIVADSCLDITSLPADRFSTVPGFDGLAAYPLGGHTPGSTLWLAAVGDKLLLFSGDITNSLADLLANRGKGFLYSYVMVPEDTARTEALRLWLAKLDAQPQFQVVVSHDLDQVERVLPPFQG